MNDFKKIVFGNIILTAAYALLTVPNKVINGGVTSFSLIISGVVGVDVTVVANVFTLVLLLLSAIFLGKEFMLKSLVSSVCYMGFLSFFHALPIMIPVPALLCTLIAGIMVGIGYYLCISANASTVGFDVVALILHKKFPKLNVAMTLRCISIVVILLGCMSYGALSIVYGVLFTLIETSVLNIMMKWEKQHKVRKDCNLVEIG